jgi:hypothetical protein
MAMTRTTISFTREDIELLRKAAKRQGSSVSSPSAKLRLMRARMASDKNPYPMRHLAEQLRKIGDRDYALAEKALRVAEGEAERKRCRPARQERSSSRRASDRDLSSGLLVSLSSEHQAALRAECFRRLGVPPGSFAFSARAWAVRGVA